ncbi:hypothetical protein GJ698_13135 [Pseudoduganella sp. FT26W]|uniref:Uncharacterized protein n=1 Tax=Duganella aquatilis TaxID=2666082 RepID=A0A844D5B9_9BURK|nr:hypothetical protein [Duganella aquatilis]MRW85025.1 hypothetical protein [Duganella aquatilis]
MNSTSLDNQSSGIQDGHLVRIVRLETNMDNVTSILASLQRTEETHHQEMLMRFDELRDRIDDGRREAQARLEQARQEARIRLEQSEARYDQARQAALVARMDLHDQQAVMRDQNLTNRIDKLTFWMAGLMITNVLTIAGLILRKF